jgi:hypothetical protein
MRHPIGFDGQLVDAAFLTALEDDAAVGILDRTLALQAGHGVVAGLGVTCTIAWTLNIGLGVAYDLNGDRIEIPSNITVSFLGQPPNTYVMLEILTTDTTPSVHPLTGVSYMTRRVDSYQIVFSTTQDPSLVTLTKITTILAGIASFDSSYRTIWSSKIQPGSITDDRFDQTGSIPVHVAKVGTGTKSDTNPHGQAPADVGIVSDTSPVQHQQVDHAAGFEPPSAGATLTVSSTDASAVLTYSARKPGLDGNVISITHVVAGTDTTLAVTLTGTAISIALETNGDGLAVSTAAEVAAAVLAHVEANKLVLVTAGGAGTGAVGSLPETFLSGGLDKVETTEYGKLLVTSGNPDRIDLGSPVIGDSVLIDGQRLTAAFSPSRFEFTNGHRYSGLYDCWARPNGTAEMTLRMKWAAAQKVTGVQVVEIDDRHPVGKFGLVVSGGSEPSLAWAGGPAVRLDPPGVAFTGDKEYRLRSALPGSPGILVQVTYGLLARNEVDLIDVLRIVRTDADLLLGQVFWTGTATGKLGIGTYGQTGEAHDRRSFGNLTYEQLHYDTTQRLERIHDETRTNGFYLGGLISSIGGLSIAVSASIVWIDGRRIRVGQARLTVPASTTGTVLIGPTGTVQFSTTDPAASQIRGRFARVASVTTDATDVKRIQDERILLGDVDEHRLLGSNLRYSAVAQQVPRISVPRGPNGQVDNVSAGRTLVLESDGPPNTYRTRFYTKDYAGSGGANPVTALEIVMNARWAPTFQNKTNVWVPDNPKFNSVRYVFQTDGLIVQHKNRAENLFEYPSWNDIVSPAWDNTPYWFTPRTRVLQMQTKLITASTGYAVGKYNPDIGLAIQSRLIPKGFIKAWGYLNITTGTPTYRTSFGMSAAAPVVASNIITLTMLQSFTKFHQNHRPVDGTSGDLLDCIVICSHSAPDSIAKIAAARPIIDSGVNKINILMNVNISTITSDEIFFMVLGSQPF